MVKIDGIIGIMIFLVFTSWSMVYFFNTFVTEKEYPMTEVADDISDKIIDYVTIDSYEIPVSITVENASTDNVFYFDYSWPSEGAKNSTMVYKSGTEQECLISGSRLYWQSDLDPGQNHFTVTYSDKNVTLVCDDSIQTSNINQTIPWAAVKENVVSQDRINDMTSSSYGSIQRSLGIERDFRVVFNVSGTLTEYGKLTPNSTDVFVKSTYHAMESGDRVDIRIMVW
ncbi:MAG: hypothetical protein DRO99_05245 [Candidatus Aenigmatarchaeota archaeon]|nr:MAG: hypothetical protein DRO99_05245 [Candidatus Aenigmarchaeota archaeon]